MSLLYIFVSFVVSYKAGVNSPYTASSDRDIEHTLNAAVLVIKFDRAHTAVLFHNKDKFRVEVKKDGVKFSILDPIDGPVWFDCGKDYSRYELWVAIKEGEIAFKLYFSVHVFGTGCFLKVVSTDITNRYSIGSTNDYNLTLDRAHYSNSKVCFWRPTLFTTTFKLDVYKQDSITLTPTMRYLDTLNTAAKSKPSDCNNAFSVLARSVSYELTIGSVGSVFDLNITTRQWADEQIAGGFYTSFYVTYGSRYSGPASGDLTFYDFEEFDISQQSDYSIDMSTLAYVLIKCVNSNMAVMFHNKEGFSAKWIAGGYVSQPSSTKQVVFSFGDLSNQVINVSKTSTSLNYSLHVSAVRFDGCTKTAAVTNINQVYQIGKDNSLVKMSDSENICVWYSFPTTMNIKVDYFVDFDRLSIETKTMHENSKWIDENTISATNIINTFSGRSFLFKIASNVAQVPSNYIKFTPEKSSDYNAAFVEQSYSQTKAPFVFIPFWEFCAFDDIMYLTVGSTITHSLPFSSAPKIRVKITSKYTAMIAHNSNGFVLSDPTSSYDHIYDKINIIDTGSNPSSNYIIEFTRTSLLPFYSLYLSFVLHSQPGVAVCDIITISTSLTKPFYLQRSGGNISNGATNLGRKICSIYASPHSVSNNIESSGTLYMANISSGTRLLGLNKQHATTLNPLSIEWKSTQTPSTSTEWLLQEPTLLRKTSGEFYDDVSVIFENYIGNSHQFDSTNKESSIPPEPIRVLDVSSSRVLDLNMDRISQYTLQFTSFKGAVLFHTVNGFDATINYDSAVQGIVNNISTIKGVYFSSKTGSIVITKRVANSPLTVYISIVNMNGYNCDHVYVTTNHLHSPTIGTYEYPSYHNYCEWIATPNRVRTQISGLINENEELIFESEKVKNTYSDTHIETEFLISQSSFIQWKSTDLYSNQQIMIKRTLHSQVAQTGLTSFSSFIFSGAPTTLLDTSVPPVCYVKYMQDFTINMNSVLLIRIEITQDDTAFHMLTTNGYSATFFKSDGTKLFPGYNPTTVDFGKNPGSYVVINKTAASLVFQFSAVSFGSLNIAQPLCDYRIVLGKSNKNFSFSQTRANYSTIVDGAYCIWYPFPHLINHTVTYSRTGSTSISFITPGFTTSEKPFVATSVSSPFTISHQARSMVHYIYRPSLNNDYVFNQFYTIRQYEGLFNEDFVGYYSAQTQQSRIININDINQQSDPIPQTKTHTIGSDGFFSYPISVYISRLISINTKNCIVLFHSLNGMKVTITVDSIDYSLSENNRIFLFGDNTGTIQIDWTQSNDVFVMVSFSVLKLPGSTFCSDFVISSKNDFLFDIGTANSSNIQAANNMALCIWSPSPYDQLYTIGVNSEYCHDIVSYQQPLGSVLSMSGEKDAFHYYGQSMFMKWESDKTEISTNAYYRSFLQNSYSLDFEAIEARFSYTNSPKVVAKSTIPTGTEANPKTSVIRFDSTTQKIVNLSNIDYLTIYSDQPKTIIAIHNSAGFTATAYYSNNTIIGTIDPLIKQNAIDFGDNLGYIIVKKVSTQFKYVMYISSFYYGSFQCSKKLLITDPNDKAFFQSDGGNFSLYREDKICLFFATPHTVLNQVFMTDNVINNQFLYGNGFADSFTPTNVKTFQSKETTMSILKFTASDVPSSSIYASFQVFQKPGSIVEGNFADDFRVIYTDTNPIILKGQASTTYGSWNPNIPSISENLDQDKTINKEMTGNYQQIFTPTTTAYDGFLGVVFHNTSGFVGEIKDDNGVIYGYLNPTTGHVVIYIPINVISRCKIWIRRTSLSFSTILSISTKVFSEACNHVFITSNPAQAISIKNSGTFPINTDDEYCFWYTSLKFISFDINRNIVSPDSLTMQVNFQNSWSTLDYDQSSTVMSFAGHSAFFRWSGKSYSLSTHVEINAKEIPSSSISENIFSFKFSKQFLKDYLQLPVVMNAKNQKSLQVVVDASISHWKYNMSNFNEVLIQCPRSDTTLFIWNKANFSGHIYDGSGTLVGQVRPTEKVVVVQFGTAGGYATIKHESDPTYPFVFSAIVHSHFNTFIDLKKRAILSSNTTIGPTASNSVGSHDGISIWYPYSVNQKFEFSSTFPNTLSTVSLYSIDNTYNPSIVKSITSVDKVPSISVPYTSSLFHIIHKDIVDSTVTSLLRTELDDSQKLELAKFKESFYYDVDIRYTHNGTSYILSGLYVPPPPEEATSAWVYILSIGLPLIIIGAVASYFLYFQKRWREKESSATNDDMTVST